jgi:hypothetical protein
MRSLLSVVFGIALAGSPARADEQFWLNSTLVVVKRDRGDLGRLTVDALTVKEKFPYAEASIDGSVKGWNDRVAVLVLSMPLANPEKTQVMIFTVGRDTTETNRLGNSIRDHLLTTNTELHRGPTRVVPADGKIPTRPFAISWKSEDRIANPILRHFGKAAIIVLEKKGYRSEVKAPFVIGDADEMPMIMTFSVQRDIGGNTGFYVVAANSGETPADKLASEILSRITRILCE